MPVGRIHAPAQPMNVQQAGNVGGPHQARRPQGGNVPNPGNPLPQVLYFAGRNLVAFRQQVQPRIPLNVRNQAMAMQQRAGANQTTVVIGKGNNAKPVLMPTDGVRGDNATQKAIRVADMVQKGEMLFQGIMSGNPPRTPSKVDLNHLMWFLQALGSSKAGSSAGGKGDMMYKSGGMNIEDPNRRLQGFLDRCNSYDRASTHMKDLQAGHPPKGVNVRGQDTPHGRKTILFQGMPPQGPVGNPKNMLYIKMEENGCRNPFKCGSHRLGGKEPTMAHAMKRFFSDINDIAQHGASWFKKCVLKIGVEDGTDNREKIPTGIKNNYKTLVNELSSPKSTLPFTSAVKAEFARILNSGNPTSDGQGIKQMRANILEARNFVNQLIANGHGREVGGAALQALNVVLQQTDQGRDHLDMRIANEVIFTREDILAM